MLVGFLDSFSDWDYKRLQTAGPLVPSLLDGVWVLKEVLTKLILVI